MRCSAIPSNSSQVHYLSLIHNSLHPNQFFLSFFSYNPDPHASLSPLSLSRWSWNWLGKSVKPCLLYMKLWASVSLFTSNSFKSTGILSLQNLVFFYVLPIVNSFPLPVNSHWLTHTLRSLLRLTNKQKRVWILLLVSPWSCHFSPTSIPSVLAGILITSLPRCSSCF